MLDIIAEIGINHNGDINLAKQMIKEAAQVGANTVKFQAYSVKFLFDTPNTLTYDPEMAKKLYHIEFGKEQFKELKEFADFWDVEFMCSVFDAERLSWMEDLGVKRHKLASRVMKYDRDLAEKVIATGKPILASLGFNAKRVDTRYANIKYLYCIAEYPTMPNSLKDMPEKFAGMVSEDKQKDYYWGFSSHYMGPAAAMMAVSRGARCIEVHFTLDKSSNGFDHIASVDPAELRDLVKYGREISDIISL